MRVLDTRTGRFVRINPLPKDRNSKPLKYAIMSHTWAPEGEQSYQELRTIQKRHGLSNSDVDAGDDAAPSPRDLLPAPVLGQTPGFIWDDQSLVSKIREACKVARMNGYHYLWADWCCIDKSNSSEVSESINSMYQWYALADVCYAFLPDVPAEEDPKATNSSFRGCRWFTRGWTLQELIAPRKVVFLSTDWKEIGSKASLGELISEITKIDYDALLRIEPLETFSVAQRFSWAAGRETERVEDRAYSLLGILNINMPTMYGEGEGAFRRLQEEIMRRIPDQSLFAWTVFGLQPSLSNTLQYNPETRKITEYKRQPLTLCDNGSSQGPSLLATSLNSFSQCEHIQALPHDEVLDRLRLIPNDLPVGNHDFTPYGIHVQLPVIYFERTQYFPPGLLTATDVSKECPPLSQWCLVILGCEHRDFPGCLLGRICYIRSQGPSIDLVYTGYLKHGRGLGSNLSDLLPVSPATIRRLVNRADNEPPHISPTMLYIPQPRRKDEGASGRDQRHKAINLILSKKNRDALSNQGYTVTLERHGPDNAPTSHSITLDHDSHTISIDYQHTLSDDRSQRLDITAQVTTSRGPGDSPSPYDSEHRQWGQLLQREWTKSLPPVPDILLREPEGWTLSLGLAFLITDYYLLSIKLKPINPS